MTNPCGVDLQWQCTTGTQGLVLLVERTAATEHLTAPSATLYAFRRLFTNIPRPGLVTVASLRLGVIELLNDTIDAYEFYPRVVRAPLSLMYALPQNTVALERFIRQQYGPSEAV